MEQWTYEVIADSFKLLKDQGTIDVTIRRVSPTTTKQANFYKLTGDCTVTSTSSLRVYGSDVLLIFGDYFTIGPLTRNEATHAITETGYDLSDSILSVGTTAMDMKIKCSRAKKDTNGCGIYSGATFTITIGVELQYEATTFTAESPVDFGSISTVSFSNIMLSDLSHVVTWHVNSTYNHTEVTSVGDTSASYTIPTSWMAACGSQDTVNCTVTVTTMLDDVTIGSTQKEIQLSVPSDDKPVIGALTYSIYNDTTKNSFATSNGVYIQNLCGIRLTVSNAAASTGASISSYSFTSTAGTGTKSNNVYTVSTITHSGDVSFTATVSDTRGRSSSKTITINVIPYSIPVITAYDAYRCLFNGLESETGGYAQIRCAASVSPVKVNGVARNTMTIDAYYYIATSGTPSLYHAYSDMASGQNYVACNGKLSPSYTYYIRFIVSDAMGSITYLDKQVSSSPYAIHVKNGGTGVAFGKTSERSQAVEINATWDLYYKGYAMPPIIYSASEPSNPVIGTIWMKKK